jgi:leucyl-tRNA synthetase
LLNSFETQDITIEIYENFLKLLAPLAPHITEEIWFSLGNKKSIHLSNWPKWDESQIRDEEIKIAVQINGKVRAEIIIKVDDQEENVKKKALADRDVLKYMAGIEAKKIIYVKNRVINIVL